MVPLFHFTDGAVLVVVEFVHADAAEVSTMGEGAIVVEHIPLAFVAGDASVHRVTIGTVEEYSLMLPRAERAVTHGVMHSVVLDSILNIIIRIDQIVLSVVLMDPGSFVKIHKSLHFHHRTVKLHHVLLQFSSEAMAAAAIVKIGLAVIIHKHTRIDVRRTSFIQPFNLNPLSGCRLTATPIRQL